jgi:hypothetical protein|tara:strand:+ start:613 stop:1023 length:411 start_codon:yes stop_codon:yes gene_type:complete
MPLDLLIPELPIPLIFLLAVLLSGLTFLSIFVTGVVRIVFALLKAARPGFFLRVCFARILLATSIGLLQVAGSDTILPFLGPDVHRNFRLSVAGPVRPKMPLDASSTSSNISCSFISKYLLATSTMSDRCHYFSKG